MKLAIRGLVRNNRRTFSPASTGLARVNSAMQGFFKERRAHFKSQRSATDAPPPRTQTPPPSAPFATPPSPSSGPSWRCGQSEAEKEGRGLVWEGTVSEEGQYKDDEIARLSQDMEQASKVATELRTDIAAKDADVTRLTLDIAEMAAQRDELRSAFIGKDAIIKQLRSELELAQNRVSELEKKCQSASKSDVTWMAELTDDGMEALIREDREEELDRLAGIQGWSMDTERGEDGKPLFIAKLRHCGEQSQSLMDVLQAKWMYIHRKDVTPGEKYLGNNALELCACYPILCPMLEWLLRDGSIDPGKCEAIHWAAIKRNMSGMEILLSDDRTNIDMIGFLGLTPLMWAARKNQPSIVSVLIKHGCNVDIENKYTGKTALDYAREFHGSSVIEILEKAN